MRVGGALERVGRRGKGRLGGAVSMALLRCLSGRPVFVLGAAMGAMFGAVRLGGTATPWLELLADLLVFGPLPRGSRAAWDLRLKVGMPYSRAWRAELTVALSLPDVGVERTTRPVACGRGPVASSAETGRVTASGFAACARCSSCATRSSTRASAAFASSAH